MKRILNFVVILLTTLSIVNAVNIPLRKRAIAFAACPSGSPQFSAASIDPDPPVAGKTATAKVTFTVPATFESGKFATDATAGGGKSIDGFPTEQDVCTIEGITCPIAAGSTVDIQTPVPIPDDVPDTYTLEYSLVDATGKEIACSSGPVTGAAKAKGDDGGKAPGGTPDGGDGGDGKAPPPDGGDGGDGPKGGKAPPPDGGDGGDGPKGGKAPPPPDGGDGGPDGKAPPDGGDGGPDGKAPPPDGGDGGDGPKGPAKGGP